MDKDVARGQMLLNKMWNASRFASTAMEGFDGKRPKQLEAMDRWLLSKLMVLIKKSTDNFNAYQYSDARADAEDFFWHSFCDNYLEAVKHRLYSGKDASAQWTLYTALNVITKLFAPILPHITEEVWQTLFRKFEKDESVHLSAWPEPAKTDIDKKTEEAGDAVVAVISAVRQWKQANQLPLNAELAELTIEADAKKKALLKKFLPDIAGTVKAKKTIFGKGTTDVPGTGMKIGISGASAPLKEVAKK
jgi:valyl-tRNA synthetase